jgi:uncharacterized protein
MHSQMFINLPVKNLPRSRKFFEGMGYSFNPQFSNEQGACLVLGEHSFAMLLTEPFFAGFTPKPIGDAHKTTSALIALSCASREKVDELVNLALAGGATTPQPPVDHGFMYQHGFHDLDGHVWEVFWMAAQPATA